MVTLRKNAQSYVGGELHSYGIAGLGPYFVNKALIGFLGNCPQNAEKPRYSEEYRGNFYGGEGGI